MHRRPLRQDHAPEDLLRGIWRENPVLVQLLGLCPTLAVTNTVANGIAMGLATFFVLLGSSILVSSLRKLIPNEVRITAYILIIATFVTMVDMVLAGGGARHPQGAGRLHRPDRGELHHPGPAGGVRRQATPCGRSALDAIGMGGGFMIALLLMGSVREMLGSGTFLGYPLLRARTSSPG